MVMVLYPENGVSPVQKALMTSAEGSNVHVVGKFDLRFLVSGSGLSCQQEISLVLAKTPPIHY